MEQTRYPRTSWTFVVFWFGVNLNAARLIAVRALDLERLLWRSLLLDDIQDKILDRLGVYSAGAIFSKARNESWVWDKHVSQAFKAVFVAAGRVCVENRRFCLAYRTEILRNIHIIIILVLACFPWLKWLCYWGRLLLLWGRLSPWVCLLLW